MSGYSGTPLPQKLGLKDGMKVGFAKLPAAQVALLGARAYAGIDTPDSWADLGDGYDYIHLFTDRADVARAAIPEMPNKMKPDGMVWVSWPKKASKVPTDMSEDIIRNRALEGVLVDVKVCAIDEIWSGLKLVVRKEHRVAMKTP